jgi:hypothetical protein
MKGTGVEASHAGICILNITAVVGLWYNITFLTDLLLSVGRAGKGGGGRESQRRGDLDTLSLFFANAATATR